MAGKKSNQDGNGTASEAAQESASEAAKAPLPLFYRAPEPVHEKAFGGKGLRKEGGFGFAAKTHAVAVHMQEFRFAAAHYPVVFSDDAESLPLAVLGFREGQNVFVDEKGRWTEGAYVPAYVRRYPFVIGQGAKPDEPILYIDRECGSLVDLADEPEADPMFIDGAPGERVKQAMEFCGAFQQQAPLTQAFVDAIAKHGLLEAKEIRLELPKGQQQLLTGLRIIDETKFNALPDEEFLAWRAKGWVAAVYWHWASMDNFRRMTQRA